jgi:acyl-CoA oxidase
VSSVSTASARAGAEALRRALDGRHGEVRERAREALDDPQFAAPLGVSLDERRAIANGQVRAVAAARLATYALPSAYGGADDVGAAINSLEVVAYCDLSIYAKCGVHFMLVRGSIQYLGTEKHHERYLRQIASYELPGCAAMTEIGHGSNLMQMRTTATYDRDSQEFVITTPDADARKDFIGNAARDARIAVAFARLVVDGTDHGVHALVVPIRDEQGRLAAGVTVEDCGEKLGLNGVDNGRITFDELRVPRDALLDRYAQVSADGVYTSEIASPSQRFFTMIGILISGRVSVAGASISIAKSALTIAIRYALHRRQFGPAGREEELLLDYRTHQRRLLPALATTYALSFAQHRLVDELDRAFTDPDYGDADRRRFEARAAALKVAASWHAVAVIQECREACGGAGYMSVNGLAALKADADPFTTFEGDNNVLLQVVAKSLLADAAQVDELDPLGTLAYAVEGLYATLLERPAARALEILADQLAAARDDDSVVRDREFQLALLRWREEHLIATLAERMKRGVEAGTDAYTVFKDCQDHGAVLARAYIDRSVLEAFDDAVDACGDSVVTSTLETVCDLYALWTIERDRGWYLEHGRMSPSRSRTVRRAVTRLCAEVRDQADALVDAFGIPDAVITAPIARQ